MEFSTRSFAFCSKSTQNKRIKVLPLDLLPVMDGEGPIPAQVMSVWLLSRSLQVKMTRD